MTQLKQNTADLDALIAKANALPDATGGGGGGGDVAVEFVTLTVGQMDLINSSYGTGFSYYNEESKCWEMATSSYNTDRQHYKVIKGSVITLSPSYMWSFNPSNAVTQLPNQEQYNIEQYIVLSDVTAKYD